MKVFELFGVEIGLTSRDILNILAEADSNDDGAIDYKEFLPVAAELIQVNFGGKISGGNPSCPFFY